MQPFQPGQNIRAMQSIRNQNSTMSSAEVYNDYFGIGLRLMGKSTPITFDNIYTVAPGSIIFIDKDLYHRAIYDNTEFISNPRIQFSKEAAARLMSAIGEEQFHSLFEQVVINVDEPTLNKLRTLFEEAVQETATPGKYSELLLENLLQQIFIVIIRSKNNLAMDKILSDSHNTTLLSAIHYIEQNFAEDPSLETTAHALHVSSSHLSRLFTAKIGTTYSDFLLLYKINSAKKLLIKTDFSITEIAALSGFSSVNYFCYAFKKTMGTSPLQYRKTAT